MPSSIQNITGANFSQTFAPLYSGSQASPTDPAVPGWPFEPGTVVEGNDGSSFIFYVASATVAQYNAVGIEMTDFTGAPLTKAMADAGRVVGFAQVALATGYAGWALLAGIPTVTLKNGCLPNVPLYTTASAGMLDDTSASQTRVYGIKSTDTATASGAAKVCWVQGRCLTG